MLPRVAVLIALASACIAVGAQEKKSAGSLPPVTVTAAARDPVEKSYRKMVQGMDLFERLRPAMAPNAVLRFKLLPRRQSTDLSHVLLEVVGSTFAYEVPIAADQTFTLQRDRKAIAENAIVSPNRKKLTMTWRTDIRTPGLPPNTRRLGDMRLECLVGLEADLVSNTGALGRLTNLFSDPKSYCDRKDTQYLFFADRPVFNVALAAGGRRESLPIQQLYAGASDDPGLKNDLPFCDCEVLVDRTYFLPLGDRSWPDDTLVEFEYMDDRP
ncbi:hypothetical protein [Ramlibacter sp. WS9]|uniref:hypothetical protein n=1 Tax=Ramlibacter sp. WS9 TaxID=1882741 RepID=UPI001E423605|nr:hypothetical protein [Ramlibacter sp. WS9]